MEENGSSVAVTGRTKRTRRVLISLAVVIVLGGITVVILPLVIESQIEKKLVELGADNAQVEDVDFNPFTGRLAVHDLEIEKSGRKAFSLKLIALKLRLWGLLGKKLQAENLTVAQGRVLVSHRDGSLTVGGIPVPGGGSSEQSPDDGEWMWESRSFNVSDLVVIYNGTGVHKEVDLENIFVGYIGTTQPEQSSKFNADIRMEGGSIRLDGSGKPLSRNPTLSSSIKVRGVDISGLQPFMEDHGVASLGGALNVDANAAVTFSEDGGFNTADMEGNIGIRGLGAELTEAGLTLSQKSFTLDGTFSYGKGKNVSGAFTATGEGIEAIDAKADRQVLSVDGISIGEVALKGLDIQAEKAELSGVRVLKLGESSDKDEPSHIVEADKLEVEGVGLINGNDLSINRIALNGVNGFIKRDKDGAVNVYEWVHNSGLSNSVESDDTAIDDKQEGSEPPSRALSVRVGRVDVGGNSGIVIRDESVEPAFDVDFRLVELHIGALDSTIPLQNTPVAISAKIGKYSSVELEGDVRPFEDDPYIRLTGKAEAIELQKLSTYTENLIGYRAAQGQLDMDLLFTLERNSLGADMKVLLVKLKMETVEGKGDLFSKLYDISFDKAVSLLRDKQGNLRLRLTVQGDLQDPQFKVRDVVRQALGKAIRKGATAYFAPIGVTLLTGVTLPPGTLFLVKKLLSWATTLRFDPVEFDPMDYRLDENDSAHLDKMAELLKDRPKVQVAICGLATLADLETLRGEQSEPEEQAEDGDAQEREEGEDKVGKVAEDEAAPEATVSEDEREQLLVLAQQRAEIIKEHLVSTGGIDAKRLVLCSPDIELSVKSPPRAEMGI